MTQSKPRNKFPSILLAIVVASAGCLPFLLFSEQIRELATLGYIGLFVGCVLTNASVFLPASGIAFTLAAATTLNPVVCALLGGLGTSCGEIVGYLCGRFGRKQLENSALFSKMESALGRFGYWAVFFFAFLPLPLFDFIGIAAGTVKLSWPRFFLVCTTGKVLKMFLYVFVLRHFMPISI